VKRNVQSVVLGHRRCLCFGVLCFLCAFLTSLLGTKTAAADSPPAAIQTAPFAMPATVLGLSNPYVVAAAATPPRVLGFTVSQDIRDLVKRFEKLARYGVDLNQRKIAHPEKVELRVRQRGFGGVIELRYRHKSW